MLFKEINEIKKSSEFVLMLDLGIQVYKRF